MPHYVSDPQDSCQILTQHFRHSSKKFDHMVFPEKKRKSNDGKIRARDINSK